MKKNNFNTLIREEMHNRFEGAVKEEILEYRKNQDEIEKKFAVLEESLKLMRCEIESIRRDSERRFQHISDQYLNEINILENTFNEQRRVIRTVHNEIRDIADGLNEKVDKFVTAEGLQLYLSGIYNILGQIQIEANKEKEDVRSLLAISVKELEKKCLEYIERQNVISNEQSKKIDSFQSKLDDFQVSNEGFVREMTVMKKTNFITEKKIEDFYTQIERLKQRCGG